LISKAIHTLEKILSGGKHLTRQEIGVRLQAEKIALDEMHLKFAISRAEIEGILCNGQLQGSKQSFTLLSEWVPRKETLHRDESLERLARKYFTSHGPATLSDFVWWSGLTLTECRKALDMIKHDFVCETLNGREFWLRNDVKTPSSTDSSALLLPPFDEFVVSYKDRPEMISDTHYAKVMTKNGIFSPTVMLDGEIVGSWKKAVKKGRPEVELSFFEKTTKHTHQSFNPEMNRVAAFYSK